MRFSKVEKILVWQMKECLVSVVVPVYNAQQYLRECIESIISQSYSNIEIILVDDGSKDESGFICDEYAKKDNRIKVIHQVNSGVVCARKAGTISAKGEYICFVDADDTVKPDMVAFFLENIGDFDLIATGVEYIGKKGKKHIVENAIPNGDYSSSKQMKYLISNMIAFEKRDKNGLLPYMYGKLYKTHIAKNVMCEVDEKIVYGEDREFIVRYVLKCNSIRVRNDGFYYYHYRSGSAENSVNKNFMSNFNRLYLALDSAISKHSLENELRKQLELFVMYRLSTIPIHMGFGREARCIKYLFPYYNMLDNKRIVLYGAGNVGMDYYRQIRNAGEGIVVLWVDKNWEKYCDEHIDVRSVELINKVEYDCIIIAVNSFEISEQIKDELCTSGVDESKIWWRKPM